MRITTSITTNSKNLSIDSVMKQSRQGKFRWDVCLSSDHFTVRAQGETLEDAISNAVSKAFDAYHGITR